MMSNVEGLLWLLVLLVLGVAILYVTSSAAEEKAKQAKQAKQAPPLTEGFGALIDATTGALADADIPTLYAAAKDKRQLVSLLGSKGLPLFLDMVDGNLVELIDEKKTPTESRALAVTMRSGARYVFSSGCVRPKSGGNGTLNSATALAINSTFFTETRVLTSSSPFLLTTNSDATKSICEDVNRYKNTYQVLYLPFVLSEKLPRRGSAVLTWSSGMDLISAACLLEPYENGAPMDETANLKRALFLTTTPSALADADLQTTNAKTVLGVDAKEVTKPDKATNGIAFPFREETKTQTRDLDFFKKALSNWPPTPQQSEVFYLPNYYYPTVQEVKGTLWDAEKKFTYPPVDRLTPFVYFDVAERAVIVLDGALTVTETGKAVDVQTDYRKLNVEAPVKMVYFRTGTVPMTSKCYQLRFKAKTNAWVDSQAVRNELSATTTDKDRTTWIGDVPSPVPWTTDKDAATPLLMLCHSPIEQKLVVHVSWASVSILVVLEKDGKNDAFRVVDDVAIYVNGQAIVAPEAAALKTYNSLAFQVNPDATQVDYTDDGKAKTDSSSSDSSSTTDTELKKLVDSMGAGAAGALSELEQRAIYDAVAAVFFSGASSRSGLGYTTGNCVPCSVKLPSLVPLSAVQQGGASGDGKGSSSSSSTGKGGGGTATATAITNNSSLTVNNTSTTVAGGGAASRPTVADATTTTKSPGGGDASAPSFFQHLATAAAAKSPGAAVKPTPSTEADMYGYTYAKPVLPDPNYTPLVPIAFQITSALSGR